MIGVSRLVYSMGIHRQMPDRLRQLHPRYGTPWVGIIIFGAIACVALAPGQANFLGDMYAFGAMLSFTIAHVAVVRMRAKLADQERPYSGPGNVRFRGVDVPLFADRRRPGHVRLAMRRNRPARHGGRRRHRLAAVRHRRSTSSTAAIRTST